jgi:hypothetical protein
MMIMDFIEDGVVIVGREATTEELAEREQMQANALALENSEKESAAATQAAKESAIEKLSALGLTVEEVFAIMGGTPWQS